MEGLAVLVPEVAADDAASILTLARRESIDLVVVGPEDPLADGLADHLRSAGIATFDVVPAAIGFVPSALRKPIST